MFRNVAYARIALAAALSFGLSSAVAACGGPSEEEQARAKAAEKARVDKAVEAKAEELAELRQKTCEDELGKTVAEAKELNSRLNIGMNYSEYFDRLADLRVVYDNIEFDELEVDCVTEVGLPLEKALNEYAAASRSWQRCFDSFECDSDDNERRLQTRWATASLSVESADDGLDDLGDVDDDVSDAAREAVESASTTPSV